jgi:hypothetical protein
MMNMDHWWDYTDRENGSTRKKILNATLFTTNPTWNGLGMNPVLFSERSAVNRLSYTVILASVTTIDVIFFECQVDIIAMVNEQTCCFAGP